MHKKRKLGPKDEKRTLAAANSAVKVGRLTTTERKPKARKVLLKGWKREK